MQVIESGYQFFKYFETEYEMDKYKRRMRYSKKVIVVEDSRDLVYDYRR